MIPIYQISLNGNPLELHNRLISLELIDKSGMEADELTLEISDHDKQIALPSKGVSLTVSFGFQGQFLHHGQYIVDEIQYQSPPSTLTIKARSADFRNEMLTARETSYHDTTLGAIVGSVASRQGLGLHIGPELAPIKIPHLDQTNESDAHLITRLAQDYDAVGTVKDGKLCFFPRASGQNAWGGAQSALVLLSDCSRYQFQSQDREDTITGVAAYYHNKKTAQRDKVIAGGGEHVRHLKKTYPSREQAQEAADFQWRKQKHQSHQLRLDLSLGRADLFAEQPIKVQGFKPEIEAINWVIQTITHTLNPQGYHCTLDCVEQTA